MSNRLKFSALLCAIAITGFGVQAPAQSEGGAAEVTEVETKDVTAEATQLVIVAAASVERLRERERFSALLPKARGIVIFPQVVKGGLIVGAQSGLGVLAARQADGRWSAPAFYSIAALSVGLQAGVEVSTLGMLVMSDRALEAFYDGGFELGGGLDLTVATLGGTADVDTAADIITFTAALGAFAGISLEGSSFTAERGRNEAYYGRKMTTREVVSDPSLTTPEAARLRASLGGSQS